MIIYFIITNDELSTVRREKTKKADKEETNLAFRLKNQIIRL